MDGTRTSPSPPAYNSALHRRPWTVLGQARLLLPIVVHFTVDHGRYSDNPSPRAFCALLPASNFLSIAPFLVLFERYSPHRTFWALLPPSSFLSITSRIKLFEHYSLPLAFWALLPASNFLSITPSLELFWALLPASNFLSITPSLELFERYSQHRTFRALLPSSSFLYVTPRVELFRIDKSYDNKQTTDHN